MADGGLPESRQGSKGGVQVLRYLALGAQFV